MAKKVAPPRTIGPDWFLVEWMDTLGVKQAQLAKLCDFSKATMNDIYHGRTDYYREIVNRVASALNINPWELLMPPAEAAAIKAMRGAVLALAAEERQGFNPAPAESDRLSPKRKAS